MVGVGDRLRDVGYGRVDGSRRPAISHVTRSVGRARLQLLRHGICVPGRAQRAPAGQAASPPSQPASVHCDQSAAEELAVAWEAEHAGRPGVSVQSHRRIHGNEPRESRRRDTRSQAAARVGRQLDRGRWLEARGGDIEAPRPDPGVRDQRQPLGAGERARGNRDRARRRRAGRLQHLRSGAGRRAVPRMRDWMSR